MKRSRVKVVRRRDMHQQYRKAEQFESLPIGEIRIERRTLLLVILCLYILISEFVEGESHPVAVSGKGQSRVSVFPVTKSLSESLEEENLGRRGMNYSKSLSHLNNSVGVEAVPARAARRADIDYSFLSAASRRKRGFFDKEEEKERMEETYYKSFRLFWFLGGVAIIFFILIFILTLLCFCCPNLNKPKRKHSAATSIPRISIPAVDDEIELPVSLDYQPSPSRMDGENRTRSRSPSVFSANNVFYVSHHRLSQEQVNMIQLQSQTRRNSNLPSTSQGLLPPNALIDVNVIQEYRSEKSS